MAMVYDLLGRRTRQSVQVRVDDVAQCRDSTKVVEGEPLVGDRERENAAGAQHRRDLKEPPEDIGAVFYHVRRENVIERHSLRDYFGQRSAGEDKIDVYDVVEWERGILTVVLYEVVSPFVVRVEDLPFLFSDERQVQGADLEPNRVCNRDMLEELGGASFPLLRPGCRSVCALHGSHYSARGCEGRANGIARKSASD